MNPHNIDIIDIFILYYQHFKLQKMAQATMLNYSSSPPRSPPSVLSLSLNQLITQNETLSEYFRQHCNPHQYWNLALQLMLQGLKSRPISPKGTRNCCCSEQVDPCLNREGNVRQINALITENKDSRNNSNHKIFQQRAEKSNSAEKAKHYNVSYIKHDRFLSPSQKKQKVTPKVTEVIPVKSTPLVIYGKPRVRVDQECGCPYHNNEQQCLRSIPYGGPCQPKTARPITVNELHVKQKNGGNNSFVRNEQNTTQLQRYRSSPNLVKGVYQAIQNDLNRTTKNQKKPSRQKPVQQDKRPHHTEEEIEQTIYVNRIIEVQSRVPGKMRVVQSPKSKIISQNQSDNSEAESKYLDAKFVAGKQTKKNSNSKEVESRIKFLIERDKRNKAMEKNMKKQQERIKILEKMVNKEMAQTKPKFENGDMNSSSNSDMSMMDSRVVTDYKQRQTKNQGKNNSKVDERHSAHFMMQDATLSQSDYSDHNSCSHLTEEQNSIHIRRKGDESSFSEFNY